MVNPDGSVTPDAGEVKPNEPDLSGVALHKKTGGDWVKANESYFNAVNKLTETHQAMEQTQRELQNLREVVQTLAGGKPVNQDPLSELAALGLPIEGINSAIDGRVNTRLEAKITEMFGPIVNQMEAEERLASEIENFDQHKAAARAFMRENPEVADVFNTVRAAKPVEAWKYAIRETLIAKAAAAPGGPRPIGLPSGQTPADRGVVQPQADQATKEAEASEYLKQYGDSRPYMRERIKGTSIERAVQRALKTLGTPEEGADW